MPSSARNLGPFAIVVVACANRPMAPSSPPGNPQTVVWRYEVHALGARAEDLLVEARYAAGTGDELGVDEDAAPFVREVTYESAGGWVAVPNRGARWTVPCVHAGCHVRYRFALREAATTLDEPETAAASEGAVIAPPSTWLLRAKPIMGRYRLHLVVDPPLRFAVGTTPSTDGAPGTFEASTDTLDDASFAVIGAIDQQTIRSGNARIDVAIDPHGLALSEVDVVAWVRTAVDGINAYYGCLEVVRTLVLVEAGSPGAPTHGMTLGAGGPSVLVRAAGTMTAKGLRSDWVMTHELLHVTLPSLSREHEWLSEGLATYVEPIVRVRAGLITPEAFWKDLARGLPQGLPEPGDQGLDRTHTWGRTYWGGALFCLMADLTLRERTHGTRSLDDVLRAIVATGADVEALWTIDHFLDVGDRATGTRVLRDLYRDMALAPGTVDLPMLWRRLGVQVKNDLVTFDDDAPLAAARTMITKVSAIH